MSVCYICCILVLDLPLVLHKLSLMINGIFIKELDCTSWHLFSPHLCVSFTWKWNFIYSSQYALFYIELHYDLKSCFESSIMCYRLVCILHIELRNYLIGLNLPCTHVLLIWLLYGKWCLIQVMSYFDYFPKSQMVKKVLVPKGTLNTNPQGSKMMWIPKNKTWIILIIGSPTIQRKEWGWYLSVAT